MKGTSLIVSVVLFVAVAILYVLYFTGNDKADGKTVKADKEMSAEGFSIAYVKVDSVILNYDLSQDMHDEFSKKQEAYTSEYGKKRRTFEKEYATFQEKLQRGGFLTKERAQQEHDRLVGKEQEITKLDQELSTKLATIQQENSQKVLDNLMGYLKRYNETKGYDYILTGSGVLIGPEANNVTAEVLKAMNEEYSSQKEDKTEESE